jgi:hypothetical protein
MMIRLRKTGCNCSDGEYDRCDGNKEYVQMEVI